MIYLMRNMAPVEPLPPYRGRPLACTHCGGIILLRRQERLPPVCYMCGQRYGTPVSPTPPGHTPRRPIPLARSRK